MKLNQHTEDTPVLCYFEEAYVGTDFISAYLFVQASEDYLSTRLYL